MKTNAHFKHAFFDRYANIGRLAIIGIVSGTLLACGNQASNNQVNNSQTSNSQTNDNQASSNQQVDTKPSTPVETVSSTTQSDRKPADANTQSSTNANDADNQISTDPKILAMGKARYETTCQLCHIQGLLNAPKPTDKAAWQPRLNKGIVVLRQNAVQGFGKMPAQAVDGISEEEVRAAVDYMVSQVQK